MAVLSRISAGDATGGVTPARAKLPDVDVFAEQLVPVRDAGGTTLPSYAGDPLYAGKQKAVIASHDRRQFDS